MNLEVFVICDAATDSNGKLNILGAFDTISFANELPQPLAMSAIVVRVRFRRDEEGEHKFELDLLDSLGVPIVPSLKNTFRVGFPGSAPSSTVNFILNFQNVTFKQYGEHSIKLNIDGNLKASLPLFVKSPAESRV